MKHTYLIDINFIIPENRFDNIMYIEERVADIEKAHKGPLTSILKYLYITDGPLNVAPERLKISKPYLSESERILVNWLKTRTNGRLRKTYGAKILTAVRNSKYRCSICHFPDVRTLQLDHIDGRIENTEFDCLCANCHQIKSRASLYK